jgi:hypothetical protein
VGVPDPATPDDVIRSTLEWAFGSGSVVVAAFVVANFLLAWFTVARSVHRKVRTLHRLSLERIERRTSILPTLAVGAVVQVVYIVVSYLLGDYFRSLYWVYNELPDSGFDANQVLVPKLQMDWWMTVWMAMSIVGALWIWIRAVKTRPRAIGQMVQGIPLIVITISAMSALLALIEFPSLLGDDGKWSVWNGLFGLGLSISYGGTYLACLWISVEVNIKNSGGSP